MFDIREILGENTPLVKVAAVGASWTGGNEKFYALLNLGMATLVGFEPNIEEFGKLQQIADERNKLLGFTCYKYLPYAVGDGKLRPFHSLNDFLNSSILPPNYAIHHYLETVPGEFYIKSVKTVQAVRLDDIKDIEDIDYLYLDTQGFELKILEGSQNLLRNTVAIQTEVCFIDLYQNQPLFSDIDFFLRGNGFYFHHMEDMGGRTCLPFSFGELGTFSQQVWTDFVYITAYDRIYSLPSRKLLALAVIAHTAYNAWDLAGHVLMVHDRVFRTEYGAIYKSRILNAIKPQPPQIKLTEEDKQRAQLSESIGDAINSNRYTEAVAKLSEFANLIDINNNAHHYAWASFLSGNVLNLFYKSSEVSDEVAYDRLIELYRFLRNRLTEYITKLDDESVMTLFPSLIEKSVGILSFCQDTYRFILEESEEFVITEITQKLNQLLNDRQESGLMQYLLALRLYKMPHEVNLPFDRFNITGYFLEYYVSKYLNYSFIYSDSIDEADKYHSLIESRTKIFVQCIEQGKSDWLSLLPKFISSINCFNLYFSQSSNRDVRFYISKLAGSLLKFTNATLDYTFELAPKDRTKIRIGLLFNNSFDADFRASIPYVEKLDKDKFEIYLYSYSLNDAVNQIADFAKEIPPELEEASSLIRSDDLDLLIIGVNVTFSFYKQTSNLSHYRLARIQIATPLCPVTTGIPNIDYFISGTYSEVNSESEAYTEKLVTIDGSGLCFSNYPGKVDLSSQSYSREQFGIPIDAVVYVTGANTLKSTPEARRTWITILRNCPDSYLILYPFYSGWIDSLALKISFKRHFLSLAEQNGIMLDRIIFVNEKFPSKQDLIAFLNQVTDVYLDSFPYSGAFSILDPLDASIPVVTLKGKYLRYAQAGALLQELGVTDLVTYDIEGYISLATKLGNDEVFRNSCKTKISELMIDPPFRNTQLFADKLTKVYEQLLHNVSLENVSSV